MPKTETAMIKSDTVVPQSDMDQMIALDKLCRNSSAQLMECGMNEAAKALVLARSIGEFQRLLNDHVMQDIMQLQNSVLGFRTDKSESGYPRNVVRDVVTQAFLQGLRVTGNEINIIAGNLYVTVNGFERLLRELPGFSNLKERVGVPINVGETGAMVPASATWSFYGVPDRLDFALGSAKEDDFRIPIRVNKGMGIDAIKGKARSKLLRAVYRQVTGSSLSVDDDTTTKEDLVDLPGTADDSEPQS